MISSDTMKEDSLIKSDNIFINQATWYLIAHGHLYTQNMNKI